MSEPNLNLARKQLDLLQKRQEENIIMIDAMEVTSGKIIVKEENLILPATSGRTPLSGGGT